MIIFGILGLLAVAYAVWVRNERRQDFLFALGGLLLLVYSIWIRDFVFIILQIIFIASVLFERKKLR